MDATLARNKYKAVDIFCGIGGLSHGLLLEDLKVLAGFDADESCRYAYEKNNTDFINKKIEEIDPADIIDLYNKGDLKILVGCAPCQPFSVYNQKKGKSDKKWKLLEDFADLILEVRPDVISMENVTRLRKFKDGEVFDNFVNKLEVTGYNVTDFDVYCPDYGIPQSRTRLVLFASLHGNVNLIESTHSNDDYIKLKNVIEHLEPIKAGETSDNDPMHKSSGLSELNLKRIKSSEPGGTWRDWDEALLADCHKKDSGKSYSSVYGRMEWEEISPTITTQYYGYGNGRFGHPEQNRALSHREAALIQTFPRDYDFFPTKNIPSIKQIGRHIGNAVPVDLGRVIAKSIKKHLEKHAK